MKIYYFLILALLCSTAQANIPSAKNLKKDLATRSSTQFDQLLSKWDSQYGSHAVTPLLGIALDTKNQDADRYIAIMGASKLGGTSIAQKIIPFLKDSSWMVRSAAIKALTFLKPPAAGKAILAALKDPALVIRLEAVKAIEILQPQGSVPALIETLKFKENYHGGKALWVPQKTLEALVRLRAKDIAPQLKPLLDHRSDPELQQKTLQTLEALTGKSLKKDRPLAERLKAWQKSL